MLSTPPATISAASPDLIARAATPTASIPEPHRRLIVEPGTPCGSPASSADMRATLRLSSPGLRAAVDHVVDRRPVDVAVTLDERLERHRAQIVGAHAGQCTAVTPDRRTDRITQKSFGHQCLRSQDRLGNEQGAPLALPVGMRLNVLYTNIRSCIERSTHHRECGTTVKRAVRRAVGVSGPMRHLLGCTIFQALATTEDTQTKPGDSYVQSFARGLAVIRAFDAARPEQTLTEVASATGLTARARAGSCSRCRRSATSRPTAGCSGSRRRSSSSASRTSRRCRSGISPIP